MSDHAAAARYLFDRLGDIETLDEACLDDHQAFRNAVRCIARLRHKVDDTAPERQLAELLR